MPANIFLLTHKCGNNFIKEIFNRNDKKSNNFIKGIFNRGDNKTNNLIQISEDEQNFDFNPNNENFFNIRCRNFTRNSTEKISNMFGDESVKYFVFTRHPASFFRSATTYHLRGNEKWCKSKKLKHFNGKTLYQSLHDCKSYGEQLVVSMKHFGLEMRLPNRWVENLAFLRDQGSDHQQVKCEDIWQDLNALKKFHTALVHDGFSIDFEQVLGSSPLREGGFSKKHATGEFKKDVFEDYDDFAKDFYNMHFKSLEAILQY